MAIGRLGSPVRIMVMPALGLPDPRSEPFALAGLEVTSFPDVAGAGKRVRKLIAFDDETFEKLKQLGRDRMATIQELADEAFADVLKKHGIPIDLRAALRKSASLPKAPTDTNAKSRHQGNKNHDDRSGSVRRRPARGTKEHSG
jgi:hypothetical protein